MLRLRLNKISTPTLILQRAFIITTNNLIPMNDYLDTVIDQYTHYHLCKREGAVRVEREEKTDNRGN